MDSARRIDEDRNEGSMAIRSGVRRAAGAANILLPLIQVP
jgi:hypothetical protein